jgi:hypothetical protein
MSTNPYSTPDGLPPTLAVKGLKDLSQIDFGEDDMNLPFHLWGHFDKALCHPWSNEIILISSRTAPPSMSQIRSLFDELNAYFGSDGHGDGPFDRKDLSQWEQFREVNRSFYFFGENYTGVRYQKNQAFDSDDFLNKPLLAVTIRRDITDPEMDCEIKITHWEIIRRRYLT